MVGDYSVSCVPPVISVPLLALYFWTYLLLPKRDNMKLLFLVLLNSRFNTVCIQPFQNFLLIAFMKALFRMEWPSMKDKHQALISLGLCQTVQCSFMFRYNELLNFLHHSLSFYYWGREIGKQCQMPRKFLFRHLTLCQRLKVFCCLGNGFFIEWWWGLY